MTVAALARCQREGRDRRGRGRARRRARPHPHLHRDQRHPPARTSCGWIARRCSAPTRDAVRLARTIVDDVEFSCEDATRSDRASTWPRSSAAAIAEGATTINIPDTVGYTMPNEFQRFLLDLYERLPAACTTSRCRCTATTTSVWPSPTRWPAARWAPARSRAASTASASARATPAIEELAMILRTRADALGGLWSRRRHARDHAHQPPGQPHGRLRRAAQQGHRRPQRLRARGRHPPARHARATR